LSRLLRRRSVSVMLLLSALVATAPVRAADKDFKSWLAGVRQEAIGQGMRPQSVDRALKDAHPIDRVLELDQRQPETTLTFDQYIDRVVSQARIKAGRDRLAENRPLLDEIGRRYGVQPKFIVALWGIETDFGRVTGDFPIISALATLAYDGRRSAFFRGELIAAIKIVDQGYIKPEEMTGSWAGAMGQSQFMPSSYLQYAVSYRDDGRRDIWHRREDVFASIANYLARLGWHGDETWGRRVQLPANFDASLAGKDIRKPVAEWQRLGVRQIDGGDLPPAARDASLILPSGPGGPALLIYDNFRAVLRWNNSSYFAAAVGYLADALE
jgi:membrane-bound lytic murein transglycosylase B